MGAALWPPSVRDRWWLRLPSAVAAACMLLLVGFVCGAVWVAIGDGFTVRTLVPFTDSVTGAPYAGIWIEMILIFMMTLTRFSALILIALVIMPFFGNAKLWAYLLSFIPFAFYGWFFATMYIVHH